MLSEEEVFLLLDARSDAHLLRLQAASALKPEGIDLLKPQVHSLLKDAARTLFAQQRRMQEGLTNLDRLFEEMCVRMLTVKVPYRPEKSLTEALSGLCPLFPFC